MPGAENGQVGSVGEEAVKLLRALAAESRAGETGDEAAAAGRGATAEHVCTTSWCPVCQVVGLVKDPELLDQLSDAVLTFARSVRDALDTAVTHRDGPR